MAHDFAMEGFVGEAEYVCHETGREISRDARTCLGWERPPALPVSEPSGHPSDRGNCRCSKSLHLDVDFDDSLVVVSL